MRKVRFGQNSRAKTNLFTKKHTKQTCILCLEEMATKKKLRYSTSVCACKPQIHDTCFDEWDKRYPGSCPICRKKGTVFIQSNIHNHRPVPVVSTGSDDWTGFSCIFGCWSITSILESFSN